MTQSAVLLSDGMDSYSLAYWLRPEICVTVDYGQRCAEAEVRASRIITDRLGIRHEVLRVDLSKLGSGDLSCRPAVPEAPASDWWPYRNQAIVTIAAMFLISCKVRSVALGIVRTDAQHVDGTTRFVEVLDELISMQEGAIRIVAPAADLSTAELIRHSGIPPSLLAWSHSCHTGNLACGRCRGCFKNHAVAAELGYADP